MWAIKPKPIIKQRWETYFDRKYIQHATLTSPIMKGGVFMELAKKTTKQTRKIVAAIVVALVIFVVSLVMRKRSN